jgi:hypothetical protein
MSVSHPPSTLVRPIRVHRPPEQFSNGITIISLYLNPLPGVNDAPPIENSIHQIMKEASLLFCLPDNPFFAPGNRHAVQEATYACTSPTRIQELSMMLTNPDRLRLDFRPTLL